MQTTKQTHICTALSLLTPRKAIGATKQRIGGENDGGYVMIDNLRHTGGIAWSLGVGPDVSWDLHMANLGWPIYQYDHTVECAPNHHPSFRFHKLGIGKDDFASNLRRLDTLMGAAGALEQNDHLLKIDIEGNEWDCLDVLPTGFFKHFRQIVAELHWLDHLHDEKFFDQFMRVIGNIKIHHESVHIHANNFAAFNIIEGIPIPPVVEVTFVNRSNYAFAYNQELSPGPFDRVNDARQPDHFLGLFQFR